MRVHRRDWFVVLTAIAVVVGTGPAPASTRATAVDPLSSATGDLFAPAYGDEATDPSQLTPTVLNAPGIPCYSASATTPVVRVFYVYQKGHPSGLAERSRQIREVVALTDLIYSMSAAKTGGIRHVRWKMASGCQLSITPLAMPGPYDWAVTQTYVTSHHLLKSNEKALAFAEGDQGCGGQGLLLPDDQPGGANRNNLSRSVALVFVPPCIQFYNDASEWAAAWETLAEGAAHELAHTLGAVQKSAPHHTAAGHCYDAVDIMCYTDAPTTVLKMVCEPTMPPLLDCGNDDYFSTNPKPGSYLAKHWNIANSRFLARTNTSRYQQLPRPGVSIGPLGGAILPFNGVVPLITSPASDGVAIVGVSLAVNGTGLSATYGLPPASTLAGGGAATSLIGQTVQLTATVYDALGRRATSTPVSVFVSGTDPGQSDGTPDCTSAADVALTDYSPIGPIVHGPFDVDISSYGTSADTYQLWVNGRQVMSTVSGSGTERIDPGALGIGPGALLTVAVTIDGQGCGIGLQYVP